MEKIRIRARINIPDPPHWLDSTKDKQCIILTQYRQCGTTSIQPKLTVVSIFCRLIVTISFLQVSCSHIGHILRVRAEAIMRILQVMHQCCRGQQQQQQQEQAGLAIKNPPKKTRLKTTQNGFMGFLGFFKFLIFYENNTNFSL
jgi:hypothetical protein